MTTTEALKMKREIDDKTKIFERKRIAELQAEIEKLTGRPSVSSKLSFLEKRAADLRARKRDGEPLGGANALVTFSCRDEAKAGLVEFVEAHPQVAKNLSACVRRALTEFFGNHNHKRMAKLFADAETEAKS